MAADFCFRPLKLLLGTHNCNITATLVVATVMSNLIVLVYLLYLRICTYNNVHCKSVRNMPFRTNSAIKVRNKLRIEQVH